MATPTKGGTKWDDAAHVRLFVAIWNQLNATFTNEDKDAIVAAMVQEGYDFNWNAIRQHLQKLKRKDGDAPATPKKAAKDTPTKATPSKAKKAAGSVGKKRKNQAVDNVDDDEDEKVKVKKLKLEDSRDIKQIDDIDQYMPEDGDI